MEQLKKKKRSSDARRWNHHPSHWGQASAPHMIVFSACCPGRWSKPGGRAGRPPSRSLCSGGVEEKWTSQVISEWQVRSRHSAGQRTPLYQGKSGRLNSVRSSQLRKYLGDWLWGGGDTKCVGPENQEGWLWDLPGFLLLPNHLFVSVGGW